MSERHGKGVVRSRQGQGDDGRDNGDEIESLAGGEPLDRNKLYNSRQLKASMGIGWRTFEGLLKAGMPNTLFSGRYYFSGRLVIEFMENLGNGGQAADER